MTTHEMRLDRGQLRRLAALDLPGPCVSIYLAPVRGSAGRQATDDALHDLLRNARSQLAADPWRLTGRAADTLLATAADLITNGEHDDETSTATFVGPDFVEHFVLPGPVGSRVSVLGRPDLLPAADAVVRELPFHLLVLSQHRVELHRCTATGSSPVPDVDLPESFEDEQWYEHHQPNLNLHGGNHVGQSQIVGMRGGTSPKDVHKESVARFVAAVDQALPPEVHDGTLPLVVVAVMYEAAMLRDTRPHRDLVLITDLGSPDRLSVDEMRAAALRHLAARTDVETQVLVERYRSLAGTGTTASGLPELLEAARQAQIDTLLVDPGRRERAEGDEAAALVELTAATLAAGGAVRLLPNDLPGAEAAVALLRY